jgi:hypothetical protein
MLNANALRDELLESLHLRPDAQVRGVQHRQDGIALGLRQVRGGHGNKVRVGHGRVLSGREAISNQLSALSLELQA